MPGSLKSTVRKAIPKRFVPYVEKQYGRLVNFGLRYACPLCGSNLRTFLPGGAKFPVLREKRVVGGGYRMQQTCPVCHCDDRERLLYLFLRDKTELFRKRTRLLHVAPEHMLGQVFATAPNIDYVTADIAAPGVMLQMDITDIQLGDDSVDVIICNHVLEHIPDDRRAMAELFRVLRPGGWAILQVPISLTLEKTHEDPSIVTREGREQAFGQASHVRIYGADYPQRLSEAGFEVRPFRWREHGDGFGGADNRFGLLEDESVFFAAKPMR